uniref:(northern house mosquito) hypothetical protein n=1 Tax=Culex pipiens TaxID=7175 RepID=A0A8D8AFD6_CULPI
MRRKKTGHRIIELSVLSKPVLFCMICLFSLRPRFAHTSGSANTPQTDCPFVTHTHILQIERKNYFSFYNYSTGRKLISKFFAIVLLCRYFLYPHFSIQSNTHTHPESSTLTIKLKTTEI